MQAGVRHFCPSNVCKFLVHWVLEFFLIIKAVGASGLPIEHIYIYKFTV
jgi:hypothetical protein